MDLQISRSEIEEAFRPAVHRQVYGEDADWVAATETLNTKLKRPPFWRRWLLNRSEAKVKETYEQFWSPEIVLSRLDLNRGKPYPIVFGNDRYFASTIGTKRVHILYLMRLIEALRPKRVLEVGSGTGQTLFILAARFPEIAFAGVELTEAGNSAAHSLRALPTLATELQEFSPLPLNDLTAHQRVVLHHGSAAALPFADRSFDLVYTVQALEQMESIRGKALREIARVSSRHAAMFEPFADWNTTPLRRSMIGRRQFFSAHVDGLTAYGLTPIFVTDCMPSKLTYGVGLVLACKVE